MFLFQFDNSKQIPDGVYIFMREGKDEYFIELNEGQFEKCGGAGNLNLDKVREIHKQEKTRRIDIPKDSRLPGFEPGDFIHEAKDSRGFKKGMRQRLIDQGVDPCDLQDWLKEVLRVKPPVAFAPENKKRSIAKLYA